MRKELSTRRRAAVVLATALVLTIGSAFVSAPSASGRIARPERKLGQRVNDYRADHGVRRLNLSARLSGVAERNSAKMARHNYLSHSANIPCAGRNGEVVASGDGWTDAFRNLRRSAPHRIIMLRPYWDKMGVGVRRSPDNGLTYVTVSFCG